MTTVYHANGLFSRLFIPTIVLKQKQNIISDSTNRIQVNAMIVQIDSLVLWKIKFLTRDKLVLWL